MKSRRILAVAAALAAILAAGKAHAQGEPAAAPPAGPRKLDLPPIASPPTGQRLPGKVIWFDLLTLEPETARAFYSGVLGWTFQDRGGYLVASDGKTPVAGILAMPAPKPGAPTPQSRWMPLISVADLSRAVAAVQKGGGKVLEGPGSLGARGRYAAVADPRGAQFVLVTTAGGDPLDADAPPPGWMWAELWTSDLKGSAAFYKAVVGYEAWQVGTGKQATWIFASGGRPRARASRMPFDKVPSQWLPYVVVKDLPGTLARVTELGGHVLRKPEAKGPQFAVVSDPGGAAFVLEQRPDQPAEDVAQSKLPAAGADAALAGAAGAAGVAGATGATGPTGAADPFGIGAAEEKSQQEAAAAAQAATAGAVIDNGVVDGGFVGGATAGEVVVAPAPFVNVWIAPPAWGAFWGPGWAFPPGWVGAPWWGMPPVWGPGWVPPPPGPGRPPYWPGYRPPPPRPYPPGTRPPGPGNRPPGTVGSPAPRPSGSAPASRPPSSGGARPSAPSSGGSHSGGSHSGGRH